MASSTTPIPLMPADWTLSGACTSGSTAPPKDATRRASGCAATTSMPISNAMSNPQMTQINTDYRTCPGSHLLILPFVACLMLAAGTTRAQRPGRVSVSTVVVVKNLNNADSVAIADYYASKRKLPAENVCEVRCTDVEEWSYKEYEEHLKRPLQQFLAQLKRPIDYIVLTKGIPIRIH